MLADWRNYETWEEAGGHTADERATVIWKQLLETYEPPAMDPAVTDALQDFVARRKEELASPAA
jgi:trimethylamine--corrinoid protein Co-methyltransferase